MYSYWISLKNKHKHQLSMYSRSMTLLWSVWYNLYKCACSIVLYTVSSWQKLVQCRREGERGRERGWDPRTNSALLPGRQLWATLVICINAKWPSEHIWNVQPFTLELCIRRLLIWFLGMQNLFSDFRSRSCQSQDAHDKSTIMKHSLKVQFSRWRWTPILLWHDLDLLLTNTVQR